MNDIDRDAILERLRDFVNQQRGADELADRGSLDRAADVMALYDDRRWVAELPAPKTTRHRGRPVDPESFSRFTKWLAEQVSLRGSRAYQLRDAYELKTTYFHRVEIKPVGERELRPLKWLRRHEQAEHITEVWELACELANGHAPDAPTVRRALSQWKRENLPKAEAKAAVSGGRALAERLKRDAQRLMEEYPELFIETINSIELAAERYVKGDIAA